MHRSLDRRAALLLLVGVGAAGAALVPGPAAGEQVSIVKLLSDTLPLYEPETMGEFRIMSFAAAEEAFPIDAVLNDMGMYTAVVDGKKVWINPADVVTSDAASLDRRCNANAGAEATSSSARAFGSGCQ